MEALALLCTLHADGPSTLKRLRKGGCDSLRAVEGLPAEELAKLVGISASTARRFAREAGSLRQRLAPGEEAPALDTEEVPEFLERDALQTEVQTGLDQRDALAKERMLAAPTPATRVEIVIHEAEPEPLAEPPVECAPISEPVTTLEPGAVDGLDQEVIDVLASAQVMGLWDLANLDARTLARTTGLPYTLLTRTRFLARRLHPDPPVGTSPEGTVMSESQGEIPIELRERPEVEREPSAAQVKAQESMRMVMNAVQQRIEPDSLVSKDPVRQAEEKPVDLEPVDLEPVDWASGEATEDQTPDAVDLQPAELCAEPDGNPLPSTVYVEPTAYEQPVPIDGDPSRRPPFWEARKAWREGTSAPQEPKASAGRFEEEVSPASINPEEAAPLDSAADPVNTTLGWNFQVPTPPGHSAPSSYPPVHLPKAAPVRIDKLTAGATGENSLKRPDDQEEGVAGPFG